jgi:hypothetical protein
LKRGSRGVYQHVSPDPFEPLRDEFSLRHNNRTALEINDQQRTINALTGIEGKRLTYRRPDEP